MKAVIFSFIPCPESSRVASTRVARFVSKTLGLPLIWDESIAEQKNLDVLLLVNGAFAFCKHLEALSHAILKAKRIVFVQNDYTIIAPINDGQATSPFRRAFVQRHESGLPHLEFWTTCEKESHQTLLSRYVNWNCLTMRKPLRRTTVHADVVYYGSFRIGRVRAFERWFKNPRYHVTISSLSRGKFMQHYSSALIQHVGPQDDLIKWLNERGIGLYLEDSRSSREYHSPPNRFYEMLSAGLPMVFPMEAGPTLRKAGYDPGPYTVETPTALARMLERRDQIAGEQRTLWAERAMKERSGLDARVLDIWEELKASL
jgi:hypothetical protein